jgi:hypothetical protein
LVAQGLTIVFAAIEQNLFKSDPTTPTRNQRPRRPTMSLPQSTLITAALLALVLNAAAISDALAHDATAGSKPLPIALLDADLS